ncbi:antigen 5 like allergen Cul n 1-like [Culicoides brevitarsis]|uniref:antigen 5 like allergen Cul n 1-like n=1 Tax=Culicoides brevitarsis TaxID=469753 RepID=UPI00307B611D
MIKKSFSDYCKLEKNPQACNGKRHIACSGPPDSWPKEECENKQHIKISPSMRDLLITEHNKWREMLASGNVPNYPAATKMMKMHWDDELAHVAEIFSDFCVFEHDECRSTDKFKKSGQNLALKMYSKPYTGSIEKMMSEMCAEWFTEYKLVPDDKIPGIIDKYEHKAEWGHFAVMARENNRALGCALISRKSSTYSKDHPYNFMLTCHYADVIFQNKPLYEYGEACSACKSYGPEFKCDENERHLCVNVTEEAEIRENEGAPHHVRVVQSKKTPNKACF